MSACCPAGFRSTADTHFNAKIAAKELADYRKAGAGVTTRFLRDLVIETRGADRCRRIGGLSRCRVRGGSPPRGFGSDSIRPWRFLDG